MFFSEIFCAVSGTFALVDIELAIFLSIFNPVIMHANCFGAALFHSTIYYAFRSGTFGLYQRICLPMYYIVPSIENYNGFDEVD